MSRVRDIANILSGGSSAIATDAEITSAVSNQFVAGKNKIINGDFGIWQRGTTSATAGGWNFFPDRWQTYNYGGTYSPSRQTFTAGAAPVAGYEGQYFLRINCTSTFSTMATTVEDVRTLAGQTATLSLWAKSNTAGPLKLTFAQGFGSGGSAAVDIVTQQTTIGTLSTSWQRYTFTTNIPSISGKTIGAGSLLFLQIFADVSKDLDVWGVQLEAGSTATNFSLATGTFATELAACQRYYQTSFDLGQTPAHNASYYGETTLSCVYGGFSTNSYGAILFPVKMRTAPTVNIWNPRNASATGNSARFYSAGVAYDTTSIDMGNTTSSSHGMTFKSNNMGATAIVFFGYSASAEL